MLELSGRPAVLNAFMLHPPACCAGWGMKRVAGSQERAHATC
jgi:hypothetical protein